MPVSSELPNEADGDGDEDITLSFPDTQPKKTLIVFYKPIFLSVDLTRCKTQKDADDVVRGHSMFEIPEIDLSSTDYGPGLVAEAPFSGAELDAIRDNMSAIHFPTLWVCPRIREEYAIRVCHLRTSTISGNIPETTVQVKCTDTVANLKKLIEDQTAISATSQKLEFNGQLLLQNEHLVTYGISDGSRVQLTAKASLYFRIPTLSTWISAFPDTPLYEVLQSFASQKHQDLASLLFQIFHSSGNVAQASQDWLPERARLFSAEEIIGTVEENGFLHGDQIQVFLLNKGPNNKRKRDPDADLAEDIRRMFRRAAAQRIPTNHQR